MTTYTKTQLIDRAIQELGEGFWFDIDHSLVVSTKANGSLGEDTYGLVPTEKIDMYLTAWQLVCTRSEFEQRVAERKGVATTFPTNTDTVIPTNDWWDNITDENPPVGTYLQFSYGNREAWYDAVILPDGCISYKYEGNWITENLAQFVEYWFRPLHFKAKLTERQQAGLKLFRALNTGTHFSDDEILGYSRFEDYCKVYDQGLLK